MTPKIIFNGKEYNSVQEMPPELRQAYASMQGMFADKDQNGVPDMFENQTAGQAASISAVQFGGQTNMDPAQLPPEAREAYEKAMKRMAERFPNGVPDFFTHIGGLQAVILNQLQSGGLAQANLDQLPPETREAYQKAMAHLSQVMADNNQNGVPDIMEGGMMAQWAPLAQPGQPPQPIQPAAPLQPSQPMMMQQPAIPASPSALSGDVESSGRTLKLVILGVGLLLVLAGIAGLVALLLFGRLF